MKMFKRIITVCMVVAMLASMLVLASCGIFKSKVERMQAKVANAKSYTTEYEDEDGKIQIAMVDVKKLAMYMVYKDEDGKIESETYAWYDKEDDKYYRATVVGNTITKYEMEEEDFLDTASNMVPSDNSAAFARKVKWGIYEKEKGVFTKIREYGEGDDKTIDVETIKVEDGALITVDSTTRGGKTVSSIVKTYDINKTKVEIPDNVLSAAAKKAD